MVVRHSWLLPLAVMLVGCRPPSDLVALITSGGTKQILDRKWSEAEINTKVTTDIELRGSKFRLAEGTALHLAAAYAQPGVLSYLITSGGNPSALDSLMRSPLSYAAIAGCQDCVRPLVAAGGQINQRDSLGNTPLMLASARSQIQAVLTLLTAGSDPLIRNNNGDTALMQACLSSVLVPSRGFQDDDAGKDLLTRLRALPPASAESAKVIQALCKVSELGRQDKAGLTAVHMAVFGNNSEGLHVLATAGANLEAADRNGLTPLHYSALLGRLDCAKVLLRAGVSKLTTDLSGRKPIEYAQNAEVTKLLNE